DYGISGFSGTKEPPVGGEVRCPFEPARARKAKVRSEGLAHRLDEVLRAPRREALLPPQPEDPYAVRRAVDPGLDPPDEPVTEEDREHVVPPLPAVRRQVHLPDVLEAEQRFEHLPVPDE